MNYLGCWCVDVLDDWVLPSVVQKGDKVDLRCNFHLSGEAMYSLKWYRDNVEFYRYIPSGRQQVGLEVRLTFYIWQRSLTRQSFWFPAWTSWTHPPTPTSYSTGSPVKLEGSSSVKCQKVLQGTSTSIKYQYAID